MSVAGAFALLGALALGACGSDDDSTSTTEPAAATTAPTATSEPAAATTAPAATTASTAAASTAAPTTATPETLPAPEMTDVKLVLPANSTAWGWLYVGEADGIFQKYGLNVTHEIIQGTAQLPSVINGDFQATVSVGNAERAALQGQPFVSLMSNLTNGTSGLVVSSEIKTIEDLKGKTIVTAQQASGIYVVIAQYLKDHGLENDVTLLSQDTPGAQETMFISGQVDGFFTSYDRVVKTSTQREGAHILLDPTDFPASNGAQAGISVTSDFLKDNPNTVRALLSGVFESTKLVLDNPERAAEVWATIFEMTPEQAKTVYDGVIGRVVLRAAPSEADYEYNAGQDGAGLERTVSVDEVKAVWDTTIAEEVYADLNCPDVCSQG